MTRAALVHVGWDARLVRLLVIGPAMAQGGPFGPLIMAIWTWLGWLRVENVCSGVSLTRIYVDDRTFVCSSASDIHERFNEWERWSSSVGVLEKRLFVLGLTQDVENSFVGSCLTMLRMTLSCLVYL